SVSDKGAFDVVTDVDRRIELYFKSELARVFPGDTLHGEEFSSDMPLSDRTWILDPIDGTYNFATGSPHYGHQAALWDRGAVQVSVIFLPVFDEMYEAVKGHGAFCNGKRLFVSNRRFEDSILSFGDYPHKRPDDVRDQKRLMEKSFPIVARLRMFGAASVDFAYLAAGRTEGVVLFTRNKWDIAPGWLLASEVGAAVLGPEGEDYSFDCCGIIALHQRDLFSRITEGIL
ncbi:MAG: hypothetical protein IKC69_05290, partial [Clostridia bacterium]|nr:hypothetical protein [Clostridia bacterium]